MRESPMELKKALDAYEALDQERRVSFFALVADKLPLHPGALYYEFDSLDRRQKEIFVSLLSYDKEFQSLLPIESMAGAAARTQPLNMGMLCMALESLNDIQKDLILSMLTKECRASS